MSHVSHCLNCKRALLHAQNFCDVCGQRTSTHRFSLKGIFGHDFIHGVFHLDRGFFYTFKMLFTKPGFFIKEYLDGKRVKYFNYFTFLILLIAVGHFLNLYNKIQYSDLMNFSEQRQIKFMNEMQKFIANNPKLVYIIMIPISSFCSFIWFINQKLNFAENLILNTYKAGAEICLGCIFSILCISINDIPLLKIIYPYYTAFVFAFGVWFYFNFFKQYMKNKWHTLFQSLGVVATNFLIYSILQLHVYKCHNH